jgi:hypothetical protein
MPIDYSQTLLLPKAFEFIPMPKADPGQLESLYKEVPYYAEEGLSGTIEEKETFSEEEQKKLDHFNRQFDALIKEIKVECKELDIPIYSRWVDVNDQYTLKSMSGEIKDPEENVFYVQKEGNALRYTVRNEALEIKSGVITASDIGQSLSELKDPIDLDQIKPFFPAMLHFTAEKKHTRLGNLTIFSDRFKSRKYYKQQSAAFSRIKRNANLSTFYQPSKLVLDRKCP